MSSYATSSFGPSGPYQTAGYGNSPYGRARSPSRQQHQSGGFGGGRFGGGNWNSSSATTRASDRSFGSGCKVVDWKNIQLIPFKKDFYRESDRVANMTEGEATKIRNEHEIRIVSGGPVPNPICKFEDTGFSAQIIHRLYDAGFTGPSPIQLQAWPIALSGRDMIGIAETGSGKTLAFILPAVVHIFAQERLRAEDGPIALILAPTRELVEQIKDEAVKFAVKIRTGVAYGGAPKRQQMGMLRSGCEIVAACPGRLIDFLERDILNLRRVTYLVLDEADRMLDMGFEPQIKKVVSQIRPDRQTLMFSATWPKDVQTLALELCKENPVHVSIGSTDLKASHNVEQIVEVVTDSGKRQRLREVLRDILASDPKSRVILFVETKKSADILTKELRYEGFAALCIHGDKEQLERKYVLDEFRSGGHPIMIATDVASRGLDVKDVKYVINYDMPSQIEDYVHRIGRTGRAGALGTSFSFITQDKSKLARDLIKIMQEAGQKVSPELQQMAYSSFGGGGGKSSGRGYSGYGGGRRGGRSFGENNYNRY